MNDIGDIILIEISVNICVKTTMHFNISEN